MARVIKGLQAVNGNIQDEVIINYDTDQAAITAAIAAAISPLATASQANAVTVLSNSATGTQIATAVNAIITALITANILKGS